MSITHTLLRKFRLPTITVLTIFMILLFGDTVLADYTPTGGEPPKGGGLTSGAIQLITFEPGL